MRWKSIAEALQQELAAYGIKIQTINPGAYYTGYNETMADNPFRWLDDAKNFTKRADLRKGFDDFFATPEGRMDPQEMIDRMIEIVPADTGKFRNVVPKKIEDMLKDHQLAGVGEPDLTSSAAEPSPPLASHARQSSERSFPEGTKEMSTKGFKPTKRRTVGGAMAVALTGLAPTVGAHDSLAQAGDGPAANKADRPARLRRLGCRDRQPVRPARGERDLDDHGQLAGLQDLWQPRGLHQRGHPALQCAHERRPEADHPPVVRGR